jgi:drug/metabolite transporter (DMT)-like permease
MNMIGRIFRMIFGFAMACLAAGLTMVLFIFTPPELVDLQAVRWSEVGLLSLAAATQIGMFAALLALIGAGFGEWHRIGSWMYYVLVAIIIAAIGFLAQYWGEAQGQASIVNNYAVTAFLLAGFVAGFVYWLFAGRFARGRDREPEIIPPSTPKAATSPDASPPAHVAT